MIDIRRYEMLVRLKEFGAAHAELFPPNSGGGKIFAALDATVDDLQSHIVAEAAGKNAARQAASAKRVLRERLHKQLTTLNDTAQIVTAGTPGVADQFQLPRSRTDQRLVFAGRAIVQEATPFADAIVAHHLPVTFLADVTATMDAFEASILEHATSRESRAASRVMIGAALAAALTTAEQLDTIVANQCGSDVGTLAEWYVARHVSRVSTPIPNRKHAPPSEPAPVPKAA